MMGRLARETDEGKKIAVVLDNARFHHAKALNNLYAPGRALERITPIYMPPTPPTLGPTEHVWNAAKANIANGLLGVFRTARPESARRLVRALGECVGEW